MKDRFKAFTLAEVLITLGIIGVIAALTLPSLIQNHRNKVVEARLKKFYTVFNQAIKLAEVEHGDKKLWYNDVGGVDLDEGGNVIENTAQIDLWFQKYLSNFITIKKTIKTSGVVRYYLGDGSSFQFGNDDTTSMLRVVVFYPGNPEKCPQDGYGKCKFQFEYQPVSPAESFKYHYDRGLEPDKWSWDGSREHLMSNCKDVNGKYCATLIQYDGWEIKEDYPHKVFY